MKNLEASQCSFNIIYTFDPDHEIDGKLVRSYRSDLAEILANKILKSTMHKYDYIVPIPMTGIFYAEKLARIMGIPMVEIFDRDKQTRTLSLTSVDRHEFYEKYFSKFKMELENKRILIVDEALISGTTIKLLSNWLKRFPLLKYSFAFVSPPMSGYCPNRNIKENERIAKVTNLGEIDMNALNEFIGQTGADTMYFNSAEDFNKLLFSNSRCSHCFNQISII